MATSAISPHSFARFITSQLDEPTDSLSPDSRHAFSQGVVEASCATLEELNQAAFDLDSEIQTIKAQVYKKLLANYSAFSESFEYSLQLQDKIDELLSQANTMASQVTHSETGLRQVVMSALVDRHEVSHKVQENNAILDGLSHFSRIEDILLQYELYMDTGKILQAGHCMQQAAKILAQPPNGGVSISQITKSLTGQCARMTEAIDQMLDELIVTAINVEPCIEDENPEATRFKLVLNYDIKVPPLALPRSNLGSAPGSVRWHELIRSLILLDATKVKLKQLQKSLIKNLLQPFIQHYQQVEFLMESPDYSSAEKSSICLGARPGRAADNPFSDLLKFFQFVHQNIFLSGYTGPEFNADGDSSDSDILTFQVGQNIAREACAMILEHYLSKVVPSDVEGLNNFGSIALKTTEFENELIAMGFLSSDDRQLQDFVEHIDIHYTNRTRDSLLKIGRAVMMSEDFKTIHVRDVDKNDELEGNGGAWGRIVDPDADLKDTSISIKSKQIIEMVLTTLKSAGSLSTAASPHLYQATRSLIDLFRALVPVYHARTFSNVPALAILFYNDCMYLARELEKAPERFEDGIPGMDEIQYDDVIPALKDLAKQWLDMQVQKQRDELMHSLDEARGFQDSSIESNFSLYERSMKQISLVFKHLGRAWKPSLSPMTFYKVLGKLLDDAVLRIIKELEDLTDISEKESHKLAALCGVLFECEDQFDCAGPLVERVKGDAYNDEDPIYYFVPSWEKFQLLTDILELSFAEIMTRFRAGQLHMFQEKELCYLVCAIFADTPLRQHNLEEIKQGHPLPLSRSS
ncbi:Centromere/kinetochore protein zw10 [Modicella reniformis]|uniref:Centromere/kinetochore protein zw10 n=1 Tax=Modicella reniformis TaxID=1440133 RepID=A0A9P6SNZ8_9FUNG|nr:Centromere/kinetochore protein zw10 [Modicella reniformis]